MHTDDREGISEVKPTGWKNETYDTVDGGYLYNRCHLIGYQLSGENANEENLITGTRYMNTEGMLPFEDMVADYVHETENHVMYRVTPVFEGEDLVASGVQMEAESVEDGGAGISFNVYVYNVQPDITIDYATGDNWEMTEEEKAEQERKEREAAEKEAAEAAAPVNSAGVSGQAVIDYACQFVGNPYVWGGTSLTNGADCSGFVQSVYAHFGISLPRTTYDMVNSGYAVSYEEAQPGDLILYGDCSHVGLYMGDGNIVNALNSDKGICICSATYTNIYAVRRVL